MPALQFGLSSYERAEGDLPDLPVVNLFAEEAPTEAAGVVLQSRPGVVDRSADMGAGPVLALFKRDNVLSTALFGVSDGKLYSGATNLGAIDGTGPFSMAGYENFLFVAGGAGLWGYDGTTLAQITFPDSADVSKVVVGASRVVTIREDTGKFYWSEPLGTTIDALDFATAENQPDRLRDMLFIDDVLVLFGAETVEFWPNTGSADLPFQPLEGRVFEKGIRATGCAAIFDATFMWVGNDNKVYTNGQKPVPISNPGLEEKIAASTECALFTFELEGNEFLALRLDGGTWVYSSRSGLWSEFQSYGQTNWIPRCFAGGVFGSAVDGKTLEFGSTYLDLGGVLERRFRAGFPLDSGGATINNVQLRVNVGQTGYLTGEYADPCVEMRISRDAAQTWGAWRPRSLGEQGEYRKRVQWRAAGMASRPGFLCEFRVTDPVPFRVSSALVNEQYGGR